MDQEEQKKLDELAARVAADVAAHKGKPSLASSVVGRDALRHHVGGDLP